DAATAFLLLARFLEARTPAILMLSWAYLFSAIMTCIMLLVFPDAVLPGRSVLISGEKGNQAISWIFQFWFWGFSIAAFASAAAAAWWPERRIAPSGLRLSIGGIMATTACAALGLSFLALAAADRLPLMIVGSQWTPFNAAATIGAYTFLLAAIALIHLRLRSRDELFRWLELALAAFALANAVTTLSGGRYTVGWTAGRILWAGSAGVVLIYFLAQFSRQQRALAEARDHLEEKIAERTTEKDHLIKVINHRIGNQLQVIQSVVSIESRQAQSAETLAVLDRLQKHLKTMADDHLLHSQSDYLRKEIADLESEMGVESKDPGGERERS